MRKVKCKKCGKLNDKDKAFKVIVTPNQKTYTYYYCSEDEYNEIQNEKSEKDECLEVVSNILSMQFVTPTMLKHINELRVFYSYKVITMTFKSNEESIRWQILNREFSSEFAKSKYIIAIIKNNIHTIAKRYKRQQEEQRATEHTIDVDIINNTQDIKITDRKVTDISSFLD
ncbi:MAG: hypothetical protein ACRCVJ_11715 [Clostridium sp.]|uniref:hypothetical protein n=1 Tax=Clostridium sp. TaxID=1506 RepID=UPI003F2C16CD